MQSEFLKYTSIIEEYTTNFHSDGILAHSGTSVTGVRLNVTLKRDLAQNHQYILYQIYDHSHIFANQLF